jgi:hypothetical protein
MRRIPHSTSRGDGASETADRSPPRGALLGTIREAVIRSHDRRRAATIADGPKHGVDGFHRRYCGMPLPSAEE